MRDAYVLTFHARWHFAQHSNRHHARPRTDTDEKTSRPGWRWKLISYSVLRIAWRRLDGIRSTQYALWQTRPTWILRTFSDQRSCYFHSSPTAGEPAPIPMKISRRGAKIAKNSLLLFPFAPWRLCVRSIFIAISIGIDHPALRFLDEMIHHRFQIPA